MVDTRPKGPYRLVTVNTAPERAKRLIGRMIEALKDRYTIIHIDNCESKLLQAHGYLFMLISSQQSKKLSPKSQSTILTSW